MSSREFHKGFQPVSEPSGVPEPGIVKGGGIPAWRLFMFTVVLLPLPAF